MQKRPAIQPETLVHAVGEFCNRFWGKPMFHSVKPIRVLSGSFLGVVLFGGLCGCDAKAQRAIQAATSKAKGARAFRVIGFWCNLHKSWGLDDIFKE